MNRRLFGALGVVVVFTLSVGSCKSDPFADVHGAPAALVTNFSYLQVAAGDSTPLRASVVDATATPLELPVTTAIFSLAMGLPRRYRLPLDGKLVDRLHHRRP